VTKDTTHSFSTPLAQVRGGDFRDILGDIPDGAESLVLTDPPYSRASIPLYGDLARLAARVLVPGGSLIAYAGNYALPQIGALMNKHLRYWHTLCLKHSGGSARLPGKYVFVGWKPLLWYVKGERANNKLMADVIQSSPPDKTLHEWEQGEVEAAYLIERLSRPGDLILDLMCGSGTTLVTALKLGRRALGVEIDEERAKVATARLAGIPAETGEESSGRVWAG
jgi:DNA modification methylase